LLIFRFFKNILMPANILESN